MKFGISLPKNLIPSFMRADQKALVHFKAELDKLTKENANLKKTGPKRLDLIRRKQYIATMQQDELKLAIQIAREVNRPRRDLLYAIYEEVWDNDGHTIGETRKAILKAIGSPFGVFKKGTEEINEEATRLLQKKWFEDTRKYFHQAGFWGHSLIQFIEWIPSKENGMKFEVKKVELVDREHVRPEEGFIVLDTAHQVGIPFRDDRYKRDLMIIEAGDPKYLGLLRVAAKEYIWKNYSRSDWSRHSEKFGMPMVAIKAATQDDKELDKLENMAREFGNNLWMILDPEDEIELKEPTFKDSYQIYKELAMFSNTEISKAISGATGTSDEKAFVGGAQVHENILNEFVEANKRAETYWINEEVFPFLIENGYPFDELEYRYLNYQGNEEDKEEEATDKPKPKGAGGGPEKKPQRNTSTHALFT